MVHQPPVALCACLAAACAATAAALVFAAPAAAAKLPQVRIDAPRGIVDEPKRAGRITVRAAGGRVRYRGAMAIEVRGNSSQGFPKRSFDLELRRSDGRGRGTALLGMDKDADWILYASYNDKSLMRSVVGHATARALGRSDIQTRHVEVTLNGRYHGVYVLMEQPEADGGALVELTFDGQAAGEQHFRGPMTNRPYLWRQPKRSKLDDAQAAVAVERIGALERALHGPAATDPAAGWRAHLDERSAVDAALLFELLKPVDAFHASTFFNVRPGATMTIGPAWDFDIAMGNANYNRSRFLGGWMLTDRQLADRLYRDRQFLTALVQRWREVRAAGLVGRLVRGIDRDARRLRGDAGRNFRRWPVLGRYVWPNPVDPRTGRVRVTWSSEVAFLRRWITRRAAWLDAHIGELPRRGS